MALSGNLQDFDLSYIIQLIAQENKTGKLELASPEEDGYLVFKLGKIIHAWSTQENIQKQMFNYIIAMNRCAQQQIPELQALFQYPPQHLSQELIRRNCMTERELGIIGETGIEDIACSLLSWKQGTYRFNALPNVDTFQLGSYTISADALTMEAARRTDELNRAAQNFSRDTVFIKTDDNENSDQQQAMLFDPLESYSQHLYLIIDGTSSVEYLCKESFFSHYQVSQALCTLIDQERIAALPEKISSTINAALHRKESGDIAASKVLFATVITITCIAFVCILGAILFNGVMFSSAIAKQHHFSSILLRARSNEKIAIATLYFQAHRGRQPERFVELESSNTLDRRDLKSFIVSSTKVLEAIEDVAQ